MDCKIPFIYIAETERSRKIMSKHEKYSYLLSNEHQDSSVRAVQLEYLGRYTAIYSLGQLCPGRV
jgi:hypothetical protein